MFLLILLTVYERARNLPSLLSLHLARMAPVPGLREGLGSQVGGLGPSSSRS